MGKKKKYGNVQLPNQGKRSCAGGEELLRVQLRFNVGSHKAV